MLICACNFDAKGFEIWSYDGKSVESRFLMFAPKYPPRQVFGFDHENTKPGNDNMVDLGCAVLGSEGYIFLYC